MRWTTNKTGVFPPPTGVTLVADFDNVGDSHTQGGFTAVLVNKTMNNFISTLQVDSSDVNGVQVSCSIGGVTDIITPQLAGKVSVKVHVSVAWYMYVRSLTLWAPRATLVDKKFLPLSTNGDFSQHKEWLHIDMSNIGLFLL